MKIEIEELINSLEKQFGPLTPQAKHCTQNFYDNYEEFIYGFKTGSLEIVTSTSVLARKIPISKYTSYHNYAGLSIILGIIGIILIFFYWQIAMVNIAVALLLGIVARYKKNKVAKEFSDEIFKIFKVNDYDGFFNVVQYYISGIIQIRSEIGAAHLPLLPSVSLTGVDQYAVIR